MARKKHKLRADFRKNRNVRTRKKDLTQKYGSDDESVDDLHKRQSVSGKGDLTRKRTLAGAEIVEDDSGEVVLPAIDERSRCFTVLCLGNNRVKGASRSILVYTNSGTPRPKRR